MIRDGDRIWEIEGHAIVSDDDRIATTDGHMPDSLRNDADWRHFQAQLDASRALVLGRKGHEVTPNPNGRLRIIVSRSVAGLERRDDGWWWNPASVPVASMLRRVVPQGGRIAVPGGRGVFDLFLGIGYDAFHLTRAHGVCLQGGIPIFSAVEKGLRAENCLLDGELKPDHETVLDTDGPVVLCVWRRSSRDNCGGEVAAR